MIKTIPGISSSVDFWIFYWRHRGDQAGGKPYSLCVTEEKPSWHMGLLSAKLWALPNLGECVFSGPYFTSLQNSYLNIPWVCTFWIIKASEGINYTNLGKWSNSCKVVIFKEKTFQHLDGELVSGVHRFPVMSCHGKSPSVSFKRWRTHYARY